MATKADKTTKKPAKPARAAKVKTKAKVATATKVVAAKATKPETVQPAPKTNIFRSLQNWNVRLAVVLIAEAIAVVVAGGSQTVPITTQYLSTDALASDAAGHQVLALATRHLVDVRLSWIVAKFLLIFAIVYLVTGTLWRKKYEAWLGRGINKLRWVAYGLGFGVMAVAVAMLSGVSDLMYLILIFGTVFVTGMLALAVELLGPERRLRRLLVGTAFVTAALPWGIGICSLLGVWLHGGTLPNFVYYIYASTFLMAAAVILACYFRTRLRGKWSDAIYAERMFMMLGFLAASVLAWQIFAGALQS